MENLKKETNSEQKILVVVTKGMEGRGGNWMKVVRRYKLLVISIRDEMYMMTIVNTAHQGYGFSSGYVRM